MREEKNSVNFLAQNNNYFSFYILPWSDSIVCMLEDLWVTAVSKTFVKKKCNKDREPEKKKPENNLSRIQFQVNKNFYLYNTLKSFVLELINYV